MTLAVHPYAGARIALATRHGKQRALGPALARTLGMRLVLAHDVDTDQLGTFTGETPRTGTAAETAVRKARLAIESTGLGLAVASEGSYGPHPSAPMLGAGQEILAFLDTVRDMHILESRTTPTNFGHTTTTRIDEETDAYLTRIGFGDHAVVVRPHSSPETGAIPLHKGVRTRAGLCVAIGRCAAHSDDGLARVETDMRAHVNPTRMREIGLLADRLASRLATLCPACGAPGYGPVGHEPGLPCDTCGEPTWLTLATIHGCARCSRRSRHPRQDGRRGADPTFCECCNP
ncbi:MULTISPECIES: DUF6671 family protein [Pseudonocardia]|jgi:hypothetical protein|uniref:DUF6671 domain-containing protein n=3 Tax=Pseudonocardia TaxID=1847 RepID=A0A1L8QA56_PSEAH|nr:MULTISPECIES: DUF6671 family protein [Pseudonocardia]OJG04385.1 hypothetical protein BG618_04268 [Pseudonocardia autotrophica]OSY36997.1 hypothetical protein BG845_05080 [Pseudonocardia autotrophica]TDN75679.1 hypothetical protein C8E95_4859 [Pseudonocardia autotrophica]BBF99652.1 hypothetical protein Pdca_08620 [Pseudonocardia autotrophica]GEC27714.1 hypothetical protein PSA01_47430 [Pseudonocardia saturnea]